MCTVHYASKIQCMEVLAAEGIHPLISQRFKYCWKILRKSIHTFNGFLLKDGLSYSNCWPGYSTNKWMKTGTPCTFCSSTWRCWWDVTVIGHGNKMCLLVASYTSTILSSLWASGCGGWCAASSKALRSFISSFGARPRLRVLWLMCRVCLSVQDRALRDTEESLCSVFFHSKHQPGTYKQKAAVSFGPALVRQGRGGCPGWRQWDGAVMLLLRRKHTETS